MEADRQTDGDDCITSCANLVGNNPVNKCKTMQFFVRRLPTE